MFPVAIQVYSVRDDAAADMMGTLKKIADMGYDGVEFAGFYGYGAEEIRAELDKLPNWVEVCRQRAEAEARERASRGL